MPMYRYRSELLNRYADGDIIVLADSEQEAGRIAYETGLEYIASEMCVYFDPDDRYDQERRQEYVEMLKKDLSRPPTTGTCFFIKGSE